VIVAREPSDDLYLGQKVDGVDVKCTLRSDQSRWCHRAQPTSSGHLRGLLYFNIGFKQRGRPRLISADVDIAILENATERKALSITSTAPKNSLIPDDAPKEERWDTKTRTFEPALEAQGFMAKLGAISREKGARYDVERAWSFRSDRVLVQNVDTAEFSWHRTSLDDETGLDRSYDGALVLRRESQRSQEQNDATVEHQSVLVSVGVKIESKKRMSLLPTHKRRREGMIDTRSGKRIEESVFNTMVEDNILQADVIERNCLSAPKGEIGYIYSRGQWLIVPQASRTRYQLLLKPIGAELKRQRSHPELIRSRTFAGSNRPMP
jgi:hypothetical protein